MPSNNSQLTVFVFTTTAVIFLLAGVIITLLYLYKSRQLRYIKELTELELTYEKNRLQSQIEIQEHAFRQIAREVHDNINLSLTLAKLNLKTIDFTNASNISKTVDLSASILTKSISDLTSMSRSLNAELIRDIGLINALESEIQRISELSNLEVDLQISGCTEFLNFETELILFRTIQECFNNIIKYARARTVFIRLYFEQDKLIAIVRDDGVGFDLAAISQRKSASQSGLITMRNRMKLLDGKFQIDSSIGAGTTITLEIPLYE